MIEAGMVVDLEYNQVIYWHLPQGRSAGSIPDSRNLWDVLWTAHISGERVGFAHSHPGSGVPGPSWTDLTTFAAIEMALGKRLIWWITSTDHVVRIDWTGPDKYDYTSTEIDEPDWANQLRELSK